MSFTRQTFTDLYDQDSGAVFEDLEFVRCSFRSCALSMARTPEARSVVRRVTLRHCDARGCFIMSPILEQVAIEGLTSGSAPVFTWGAVFDRVTLAGKVDNLVLSSRANPVTFPDADGPLFEEARKSFYSKVNWALDIREVEAQNLEIYDVPAELVRRNSASQAVVRRKSALDEDRWRGLDLEGTWWPSVLETLINQGHEETVLVTPRRHKHADAFIEGIKKLRSAGVAESD